MSRTNLAPAPDPVLVHACLHGSGLIAEIEDYLAAFPPFVVGPLPPSTLPTSATPAAPYLNPHGTVQVAWDAHIPGPSRSLRDRLHSRPAAPVHVSVCQFLDLVSRYMVQYGWCQRGMYDQAGRVCLLGAMTAVQAHGYGNDQVHLSARGRIIEQIMTGPWGTSIEDWNDHPSRTRADIQRELDRAIVRTR